MTLALLTVAYIAAGRLSLLLAFANENASPVWPPTGLAIGALLILGLRAWPAIAVGAFVVNLTNSGDPAASLAIAVGNTLEAVAGAWLTLRFARGRAAFDSTRDVLRFVVIAAGASAVAASIGVAAVVGRTGRCGGDGRHLAHLVAGRYRWRDRRGAADRAVGSPPAACRRRQAAR